jgi:hypothetical protein
MRTIKVNANGRKLTQLILDHEEFMQIYNNFKQCRKKLLYTAE